MAAMSLAGYKRALDDYVAGDDGALSRMTAAVTPRVAAQLGDIEHRAAVHLREQAKAEEFAAEVREQAIQAQHQHERSECWAEVRQVVGRMAVIVVAAFTVVALVVGLTTRVHHTAAYDQRAAQQAEQQQEQALQQAENLQAQPAEFTPAGWVTLYQDGQPAGVVHVHSSRVISDGMGNQYLQLYPFGGQPYEMLLGSTTYLFTTTKPAS